MEPAIEARLSGSAMALPAEPSKSAASWSAIIAGAFVAAAVSLVLLALGSALGFASVSPWEGQGMAASTFAMTTAIWFIVMQWVSSAFGGYIAGRLRTRWIGTNPHEVFFRDTAHGFVTWAVATVAVAAILVLSVAATVGGGVRAATAIASGAAQGAVGSASPGYIYGMDRLFRPSDATAAAVAQGGSDLRAEVTHVIAQAVATNGTVSDADQAYLASLVAARTGVSPDEAKMRVSEFIATANDAKDKVKSAADAARKAAAKTAIFAALAMVIGAFIAAATAALGGHLRDEHP
jgi:hypothetical protein